MNLIQIQDRLRGMPIQLLQQYANGSNPEVPPYIALGVLKQKEAEMQQHANAQGAAQGQMPSVKSQLEQKVGTLQQQASMMPQGLAQPATPAPQGPVQAAAGGLMSGNAGSAMKFAEGGIIGYSGKDGSKVEGDVLGEIPGFESGELYATAMAKAKEDKPLSDIEKALLFLSKPITAAADVAVSPIQGLRNIVRNPLDRSERPSMTPASDARQRALYGDQPEAPPAPTVVSTLPEGNVSLPQNAPRSSPAMAQGLGTTRSDGLPRPPAVAPTGAPGGAGLGGSSVAAMLQKQLGKEIPTPTAEGAAKSVQDINKQFGLDTPAGKEERELIAQMRAQREGQLKDRGFDNLVSFLTNARGSNLGETFASGARASQSEIEKQRADDLAHQQKMYEMVSGLNKANRAEQVGSAGKAATLFGDEQKSAATAESNRLTSLANIYHTDVAAAAQIQAQKIAAAARSGSIDDKQQLAELKALQASIQAQIKATPFDKKVVGPLQEQLATVNSEIARMAGVGTISAAPGASNAGGNAALYSKADAILNGKK